MTAPIVRCAWCPPAPLSEGVVVSHGICDSCAAKLTAEIAPKRETEPFKSRGGTYYGHYGV